MIYVPGTPEDPVELAMPIVSQVMNIEFDSTKHEDWIVEYLDEAADGNGLFKRWSLATKLAFSMPAIEENKPVKTKYTRYESAPNTNTHIVGDFCNCTRLAIGEFIGIGAVRAFCLTFDRALIVSTCEELPATDLLHVPVMAVRDIAHD